MHVRTRATHLHTRGTRARPRVGVCPMICSSAIMPLARHPLLHPLSGPSLHPPSLSAPVVTLPTLVLHEHASITEYTRSFAPLPSPLVRVATCRNGCRFESPALKPKHERYPRLLVHAFGALVSGETFKSECTFDLHFSLSLSCSKY